MAEKNQIKLTIGAAADEPGSSKANKTGSWTAVTPVLDESKAKCIKCFICWMNCPDSAIQVDKTVEFDYDYCKGCGICAKSCPVKVIKMINK